MDYEGYNSAVCDAEESDWLDISYTERKYVDKPKTQRHFHLPKIKIKKVWTYAAIALVCVALLATLLFVDGNFTGEVFNAVKTASTSVFTLPQNDVAENKINIPCNLTLQEVNDGVMTFGGGRAALSLTAGKVTEVGEDSVTIAVDEDTQIVYSNLKSTYVAVGDEIAENTLLGKYEDSFSASIYEKGEIVKQVVGSESQLKWSV